MVKVAVLGYGNIGSGVVTVIQENQTLIEKKIDDAIEVKYVLDLREFPGDPMEEKLVHDVNVILEDPEIGVVCETMGGVEPAYTFSKKALLAGKSVCTSNKELVAAHGAELLKIAAEQNVNYMFEASVGGGIPIIRPLNHSLIPEKIEAITGIMNGTTNYMLTKMAKEGCSYEDVLKEAQEKGYAEKNPAADVEGYDACRKIAILSSLMCGKTVDYNDIYTEGITKITDKDFKYAQKLGMSIKLLAMSKDVDGELLAMVAPFLISETHPLFAVNDVFNGILVHGNMLDDAMFYGRGAGKLPTASAVVSDVMECARNAHHNLRVYWSDEKMMMKNVSETSKRFFVRAKAEASADVRTAFGLVEKIEVPELQDEFAFLTDVMTEKEYRQREQTVKGILSMIRVES
ncbi:MAG: homoserine dehydrogenase [Clostridium sp.]|nr:homoserine dehydrogenase [Clostridium sp.]